MITEHKGYPVLITGGSGFAARYLAEFLAERNHEIHLVDKTGTIPPNLHHFGKRIIMHRMDLTAPPGLARIMGETAPREIYHLAGMANVKNSWESEALTYRVNVIGAVQLLAAIRNSGITADILIVGSGEVYGHVPPDRQPIDETYPLHPGSPYAASKLCQEIAAGQMHHGLPGKIVFVRPFNHIGPGQHPGFVASDFARQIARIERGEQPPVMYVGNLDAKRDFSDVHDTVEGYVAALRSGRSGDVYNISSGKTLSIRDILDHFLALSTAFIEVRPDPDRFRPVDVPVLCGSSRKLQDISGWRPFRDINRTLADILDYWRLRPGE